MTVRGKPNLLIVEDDERLRYLVGAAAERCARFATIAAVGDGESALHFIRRTLRSEPEIAPDYVLSDLSMPRLDGLGLIRELKRHPETERIPIVIMTSSNQPNDREDAMAAGCCAFFYKPQRLDELTELVGSLPSLCGAARTVDAHAP